MPYADPTSEAARASRREARRRWKANNPEKVRAERKRYKEANPEKVREYKRQLKDRARIAKNLERYGQPDAPRFWAGDDISYSGAHARVSLVRGKAAEYACVGCGQQADEWSYNGGCMRERVELRVDTRCGSERAMRYSPDPDRYVARCRSCHTSHDRLRPV